jgi:hypothetical protein
VKGRRGRYVQAKLVRPYFSKFVWISLIGLLLGGWWVVRQQAHIERLRDENASLQRDLEGLRATAHQTERLRLENDALSSRVIDPVELARLRANSAELRRLRAAGISEPNGGEQETSETVVPQSRSAAGAPTGSSPTAAGGRHPQGAQSGKPPTNWQEEPALRQSAPVAPGVGAEPSATQQIGGIPDSTGSSGFPGGAAAFTGPVSANLDAGQTLLTGGWEIGEGQRGYVLVTPVIDPNAGGDPQQIAFDLRVIRIPESQISPDSLGEWVALNSATPQIGVLDAAASANLLAAFEATPDTDVYSNLQVAGTNRMDTHVQFGGSSNRPSSVSLHLTPDVEPGGGTVQLGVTPRLIAPR